MTKTFNRNPNGINQWQQRSNQEIQEIITVNNEMIKYWLVKKL